MARLQKVYVIDVHDGDTLTTQGGIKYRLYGIDAPELAQPDGAESGGTLLSLVEQNKYILYVQDHGLEIHRRHLATFYTVPVPEVPSQNINYLMVKRGEAWVYRFRNEEHRRHPPITPSLDVYEVAERQARLKRRGLWANPKAERPSEFRHKRRAARQSMREQLEPEFDEFGVEIRPRRTRKSLWELLSRKDGPTSQFATLIARWNTQLRDDLGGRSKERPNSKDRPFTIFAPRNGAERMGRLEALPAAQIMDIRDLIKGHIVPALYLEKSFGKVEDAVTLVGQKLTLQVVSGKRKIVLDKFQHVATVGEVIKARNGMIYVIDKVLGPTRLIGEVSD